MEPVFRDGLGRSPTFDPVQVTGRFTLRQARIPEESRRLSMNTSQHPIYTLTGHDYREPIYVTRDGKPRFMIGGGSGVTPPPGPPAAPAAPPAPAPEPTPPPAAPAPAPAPTFTPPAPAPAAPAAPAADPDALPEDRDGLVKMIGDLRKENASSRTTAKQQAADEARKELAQTIGVALGLVKDDKPVDPAELAKQIEQSKSGERTAQVHLAVFKAAPTHQGDPTALLDSSSFLAKLSDLDPTASDFDAKVGEVIKTAVDANPKLKSVQAPGSSSVEHPGGGSTPRRTEAPSMQDAVNTALGT